VLRTPYERRYFDYRGGVNASEVADELGITDSPFAEHLASAQAKLPDELPAARRAGHDATGREGGRDRARGRAPPAGEDADDPQRDDATRGGGSAHLKSRRVLGRNGSGFAP
jgi:hypothetical protein